MVDPYGEDIQRLKIK